jgi:hypothetical protein
MAIDWLNAIALYHQGDWTLAQLQEYAAKTDLPTAAASAVRAAQEIGAALQQKARLEAWRRAARQRQEKSIATLPLEISAAGRRHRHELTVAMPAGLAMGPTPSRELAELCQARGNFAPLNLLIHRYLTDDWDLIVRLSPSDQITAVRCGDDAMVKSGAFFVLTLADHLPATVLDAATREIAIEFRDGFTLALLCV